jgi:3-phenylpropionate/trans-cinnamate dioxygenase ferredoxin component
MAEIISVCPTDDLQPGQVRTVSTDELEIGVFNVGGTLYAIEDRCSHDDGPLAEGLVDPENCTVECPRHGAKFDLRTGRALTLPAYEPVEAFPVSIDHDTITLEVS